MSDVQTAVQMDAQLGWLKNEEEKKKRVKHKKTKGECERSSSSRGKVLRKSKLGLWEYWKQLLIFRKSAQIVEEEDSPGCTEHKDTWSSLEGCGVEEKNKHRQTINLICVSTEPEWKHSVTDWPIIHLHRAEYQLMNI